MNAMTLTRAQAQISKLESEQFYADRYLEPPDAHTAAGVVALADARGVTLSPHQWARIWKLGRAGVSLVLSTVAGRSNIRDVDDAVSNAVSLFRLGEFNVLAAA